MAMKGQLSLREVQKVDLSKLLYRYQKIGANYLHNRTAALLADQMGLGKTIQALASIRDDEGAVIVCPASLIANWKSELQRFRPDLDLTDTYPAPGEVRIMAYSKLPAIVETKPDDTFPEMTVVLPFPHLADPPPRPFTLILDEAHYVKSPKAKRTKQVRALAHAAARVWALTGTPLMNHPSELWALLQAIKWSGKTVFGSWDNFLDLFNGKKLYWGGYEWGDPKEAARERLDKFMLRRTREEVLPDLPTKIYKDVQVPISKTDILGQDFRFIDSWEDQQVESESKEGGALSQVRAELAEAKHAALESILDEFRSNEEPVVVFSQHLALPTHYGARPRWGCITGATSLKDRNLAVRAFQDGLLEGIAGTIGAMGVGLTLTRAAQVIFVDRSFVPTENLQAEDRLCRIGQTRGVIVTRLVADHPVDARVAAILGKKERLLIQTGLI